MIDSFNLNLFSDSHAVDDTSVDLASMDDSEKKELVAETDTIAALAYSAPEVSLNPQLKQRLFNRLGLQPDFDIYSLLSLSIQALKSKATALPWQPIIEAPGFETAICHEDDSTRTMACFIRADLAASFPSHTHAGEEIIVVLGGDIVEGDQVYTSGDRIQSDAGSSHLLSTTQGCLLLCITSMDNQFD